MQTSPTNISSCTTEDPLLLFSGLVFALSHQKVTLTSYKHRSLTGWFKGVGYICNGCISVKIFLSPLSVRVYSRRKKRTCSSFLSKVDPVSEGHQCTGRENGNHKKKGKRKSQKVSPSVSIPLRSDCINLLVFRSVPKYS